MLKFILVVVVLYLLLRLAAKVLRATLFFKFHRDGFHPEAKDRPFTSSRKIEEAEYEVLETRLKDDEGDSR